MNYSLKVKLVMSKHFAEKKRKISTCTVGLIMQDGL